MAKTAAVLLLVAGLLSASYLAKLDVGPAERAELVAEGLPVYKELGTSLFLPLSEAQLASLTARGWQVEVLDTNLSPGDYFIIYKVGLGESTVPGRLLWENERLRLVRMPEPDARALKAAGCAITQLRLVPCPLPSPASPLPLSSYAADTTVGRIVSLVSQDSLARTIQDLEDFGTRYSYYPKCESAAFYLKQRLTDLGYSVRLDTYYLQDPITRAFNVEATLAGQVVPESMVVACAHFDSYNGDNQNAAPGANDDGTGTAAVIELARVLKQAQFSWSVKFLCFSGEEQWMKGSYHWVDATAVPQGLKIAGAYNLDMFGFTPYDTNTLYVTRNSASLPLAVLAESANAWYDIGLQVVNFLDEDCAGDNAPFWEHGYKAVFACEDSEWGIWNGSDPHYHTDHDTFGNLRMGQVRRTSQLAAACIATLAGPYNPDDVAEQAGSIPQRGAPATVFVHALDLSGRGRVTLLDASGRQVGTTVDQRLSSGIYFIRTDDAVLRRVVKVR